VLEKSSSQANLGSAMGSGGATGGVEEENSQPEPSMMRQGSAMVRGTIMGASGPNAANQKLIDVVITWEGQPKNILGRFQAPEQHNLVNIDSKFQKQLLLKENYVYIFRNEVIPKAFWDIFTAKVLGASIMIRPAEQKTAFDLAAPVVQVTANNDPNYVSPYKRDANAKIIQEKKKEVSQELHRGKFRPLGVGKVQETKTNTGFKDVGTLPPGVDTDALAERAREADEKKQKEKLDASKKVVPDLSKVSAGGSVEDLFKARAKALF